MAHKIRKIEEKTFAFEVELMVWNGRMDLLAVANKKGDVSTYRLSLIRAYHIESPIPGLSVKKLAWRPDGKVLLIAYSNGDVRMMRNEDQLNLLNFTAPGDITFVSWVQQKEQYQSPEVKEIELEKETKQPKFVDSTKPYMRDPPPISETEGSLSFDLSKSLLYFLQSQADFNVLLVGTNEGILSLYIFGYWNCANINLSERLGYKCSVKDALFNDDMTSLFATVTDEFHNIQTIVLNTSVIRDYIDEFYYVAVKNIKLKEMIFYLDKVIANLTETWESILLEIDSKLYKYARKTPAGGVTADFLELLMCETCSPLLEEFLLVDLTKKGLEAFGHAVETSYSTFQTLLLKHIIRFSQNGVLHLSELKGMARFKDRYGVIGLDEDVIQKAYQMNGAFLIKASEMQEMINLSISNFKAFFRWLYSSVLGLLGEPIPDDFRRSTQRGLRAISIFIQNFDCYGYETDPTVKDRFMMERVGQYLIDRDLKIEPEMDENDWTKLLAENQCLREHPSILPHHAEKSLVQMASMLKSSIDAVFETPLSALGDSIVPMFQYHCFNFGSPDILMSSINVAKDLILFSFMQPSKNVHLLQVHFNEANEFEGRSGSFYFNQQSLPSLNVLDLQFYSKDILSLLLQECDEPRRSCIFQLSIPLAIEHITPFELLSEVRKDYGESVNAWDFSPRHCKMIDMQASIFAVSARRLCLLLSQDQRNVQLFELECDDEDTQEDTDMSVVHSDDLDLP